MAWEKRKAIECDIVFGGDTRMRARHPDRECIE